MSSYGVRVSIPRLGPKRKSRSDQEPMDGFYQNYAARGLHRARDIDDKNVALITLVGANVRRRLSLTLSMYCNYCPLQNRFTRGYTLDEHLVLLLGKPMVVFHYFFGLNLPITISAARTPYGAFVPAAQETCPIHLTKRSMSRRQTFASSVC